MFWYTSRDDYGRTVHTLTVDSKVVGVLINLPKVARAELGTHMFNDFTKPRGSELSYYRTSTIQAKRLAFATYRTN